MAGILHPDQHVLGADVADLLQAERHVLAGGAGGSPAGGDLRGMGTDEKVVSADSKVVGLSASDGGIGMAREEDRLREMSHDPSSPHKSA